MLLQCKKKWKIIEAVNRSLVNIEFLCERVAHNLNKWKSGARLLFAGISNPARARCTRTATTAAPDCAQIKVECAQSTEHAVKQQKIAHTYHYRKGACCTCSATTTPITPYCAQSAIPSCTLRISRQRCTRTQTHTYQRNAKKALCACMCMLLLLYPQMSTHQCTNVCTVSKHKKHTMHYRCTNAALAVLPPFATTGSPASICAQFTMCSCAQSFETMYIYMYLFNKWHVSLRTVHRLMCTHH